MTTRKSVASAASVTSLGLIFGLIAGFAYYYGQGLQRTVMLPVCIVCMIGCITLAFKSNLREKISASPTFRRIRLFIWAVCTAYIPVYVYQTQGTQQALVVAGCTLYLMGYAYYSGLEAVMKEKVRNFIWLACALALPISVYRAQGLEAAVVAGFFLGVLVAYAIRSSHLRQSKSQAA